LHHVDSISIPNIGVYLTRPNTNLLSQWSIGVNNNSKRRSLIVIEEVEVDKTS
jgi:hypothetical protein